MDASAQNRGRDFIYLLLSHDILLTMNVTGNSTVPRLHYVSAAV